MATIQIELDDGLEAEAAEVLADMGLTVPDVVRMALTRIARDKALPFDVKVSAEELARRREAVDFARVNCELEGLPTDEEFNELHERYARGEIHRKDLDEYRDRRLRELIDAQAKA